MVAFFLEPHDQKVWDSLKPLAQTRTYWDMKFNEVPRPEEGDRISFAVLSDVVADPDVANFPAVKVGIAGGKAFMDELERRFLRPGEVLRRIDGRRAALLRARGLNLVVLEMADGTWSMWRIPGFGRPEDGALALYWRFYMRARFAGPRGLAITSSAPATC